MKIVFGHDKKFLCSKILVELQIMTYELNFSMCINPFTAND